MLTPPTARVRGNADRGALLLVLIVGVPLTVFLGGIFEVAPAAGIGATAVLAAVTVYALIRVRQVLRLIVSGLVGGGAAGLIALGAGSRLAMRIVSLTGGRREVTIDGTMFLLIAGAMLGAMVGLILAGVLRLWRVRGWAVGTVLMVFPGSLLMLDSETGSELFDEGLGIWLNLPMFLAVLFLYGLLAVTSIRWVASGLPGTGSAAVAPLVPEAPATRESLVSTEIHTGD